MARDYTPLPFEYLEEMDCLSDAEYGRLIRGLQHYSITGEEPKLSGQEKAHWKRVRNRENRYREGFDSSNEERTERARRAARARWDNAKHAQACTSIASIAQNTYTDTDTDTNTNLSSPVGEGDNAHAQKPPPQNPEFAKVMTHYMDYVTAMPSPVAVEGLQHYTDCLSADVVIHALNIAIDAGKRDWRYIRVILDNYEKGGIKSVAMAKEAERQYQESKHRTGKNAKPFTAETRRPTADDDKAMERLERLIVKMQNDTQETGGNNA